MRFSLRTAAAAAALALAAPAIAQQTSAGRLSAFSAPEPVGTGMLHLQFGWPGLSATYLYGLAPRASVGGRFSFNYGFEGQTGPTRLGLKLQGMFRLGLMEAEKFNLGLELAPGLLMYFPNSQVQFGLTVPIALVAGIPMSDAFSLHLAIEVPMAVTFTYFPAFFLPLYFGGGLEYVLDRNILLTFALRMGPLIDARFGTAAFGLNLVAGVAFKI